jgi:integrase/recombinase XerD
MEKFKEYCMMKGYSSKTTPRFIQMVQALQKWMEEQNIEEDNITYNDVMAYVHYCREKGHKASTLKGNIYGLKIYFNYLQHEGILSDNPAENIDIKGVRRRTLYDIFSAEELDNLYNSYRTEIDTSCKYMPPQQRNELARKRNKVILGLVVYQALRSGELEQLTVQDIKLREGKIHIQRGRTTNQRALKLEPHQVFDMLDYINETRKAILHYSPRETGKMFIGFNNDESFNSIIGSITLRLKTTNARVKNMKQVRASVITHWLKLYNLRKVQYMAGHRYISSTEKYLVNDIEDLQDDIKKFHPMLL